MDSTLRSFQLSLDKTSVQLGSTVVDERLFQSVTLKNAGALGTNYRLVKSRILRAEQNKAEANEKKTDDEEKKSEVKGSHTPSPSSMNKPTSSDAG